MAYCTADLFFLAGGIRNGVALLQQVGGQLADVIGEIDILRKPVDDAIDLGQRGAALESEFAGQIGFVDGGQHPDHPDVFFEQVCRPPSTGGSKFQGFNLIVPAERKPRLSHVSSPRFVGPR